jgi:hypothetical protein
VIEIEDGYPNRRGGKWDRFRHCGKPDWHLWDELPLTWIPKQTRQYNLPAGVFTVAQSCHYYVNGAIVVVIAADSIPPAPASA